MPKIFLKKTILTTLIGTSIASSTLALPVRANQSTATETIFNQNNYQFSDPIDQNKSSDNLKNLIGIVGLAIGTSVIGWHLTRANKPSFANSVTSDRNNLALLNRINPKLRRELLRLVHDRQTANRLLSGSSISHPERSPNWLAEKVIYDLKRDR